MQEPTGGVSLFAVEAAITLVTSLLAFAAPRFGLRATRRLTTVFGQLARRRGVAVLLVTAAALLGRSAILPIEGIPKPYFHDEFSYLLAADTFSSGRLTNPTHPMWQHLETFHVDQKPTYMSMYFPGQGMVLAAGKRIFGHPWFGVWLSCGLMCGAICWMLQAWLPPSWALLGGLLCVLRIGLFSYWMNSYWGGAVAGIGGALLLGAFGRLLKQLRLPPARSSREVVKLSLILSTGLVLLANSRPWEGAWLTIGVMVSGWLALRRAPILSWRQLLYPVMAVMVGQAAWMGYYDWKLYGDPLTPPYKVNRTTYAVAPYFVWQKLKPAPEYRHEIMRDFYVRWEAHDFLRMKSPLGLVKESFRKIGTAGIFFFAAALLPPFVMLRRVILDHRIRSLLIAGAIFCVGVGVNAWMFPHYAAPVAGLLYVLLLQSMRHLKHMKFSGEPAGAALVKAIPVVCVLAAAFRLAAHPLHLEHSHRAQLWYGVDSPGAARSELAARVASWPGKHLLVVRYRGDHDVFDEWVYNAADIDASKVVWSRYMGPEHDRELMEYFANRCVWLLDQNEGHPTITPYPGQQKACGSEPMRESVRLR